MALTLDIGADAWTIDAGDFTYRVISGSFWNMGGVVYHDPTNGHDVDILVEYPGAGNGLAWRDVTTLAYHGTIHGGEDDVVIWAELDGNRLDLDDIGTHTGDDLVIYRTSYVCGQYWTWEWRPTATGWYDKFTQAYPTAVSNWLYYGYTSMLIGGWDLFLCSRDDADAFALPHGTGTIDTYLGAGSPVQDLYFYDTQHDVRIRIHWSEAYASTGAGEFVETRATTHLTKYYPRRPYLTAGETRTYERTIEVAGHPALLEGWPQMIITYENPDRLPLQVVAQNPDGSAKLDVVSGTVRVYSLTAGGVEAPVLTPTALVGTSAPIWRYVWQPATLGEGYYIVEYTLTDGSTTIVVTEDLVVRAEVDVEAALEEYGVATATDVEAVPAATDAAISNTHGSGLYDAAGGPTAQEIRDSAALPLTLGTTISGSSIERRMIDILTRSSAGNIYGTALRSNASKVYVGDVGVPLYFDFVDDLTTATKLEVHVVDPSGASQTWAGSIFGTHEIKYSTTGSDIATHGSYRCTPYAEFADGSKRHRATVEVVVYDVGD